ncbi:MAG: rhomboid family intramembrane serine protease [Hyphomicrobiaceae bacterium]|nr:rhomboid family intramembrane serine protease [Hyphomicrobiaceae bacterium]
MDLQLFLTLGLMSYAAAVGFMAVITAAQDRGTWLLICAAAVGTGLFGLLVLPEWAALLTALVVVPGLLVPIALMRIVQNRMMMSRWRDAARSARLLASLHPSRRAVFEADLAEAIAQAEETGDTESLRVLARDNKDGLAHVIEPLILSREDRWDDVLAATDATAQISPDALVLRIRALGETGKVDEMAATFAANRSRLAMTGLAYGELFVASFLGRGDAVDVLLGGPLRMLEAETRAYWRAIAAAYATSATVAASGREALASLGATSRRPSTRLAARRHADLAGRAALLSDQAQALGQTIADDAKRRALDVRARPTRLTDMPLTIVLIILNLGAFAAAVALGGAEDIGTLVGLGALWPPFVTELGQWWRLVTAAFLHFGPVHLVANMLALLVFGRIIEATYGTARLALVYGIGILVSSGLVLALMLHEAPQSHGVYLGASGAIFALFGAETARMLKAWRTHRDAADGRHLMLLIFIMGLQTLVDLAVPEISLTAHLSGFLTGAILGLLIAPRETRGSRVEIA